MYFLVNLASSNEKSDEAEAGYFDPLPLKAKSYATEQWTWIENQLSQSKADYILVSGHYPVSLTHSFSSSLTLLIASGILRLRTWQHGIINYSLITFTSTIQCSLSFWS